LHIWKKIIFKLLCSLLPFTKVGIQEGFRFQELAASFLL